MKENSNIEFFELLRQILNQECKPVLSEEEIHFDVLAMKVMELVGDSYVVWLN